MKKVLTVLTILVVVLGCVFAEDPAPTPAPTPASETHNITIATTVDAVTPSFQLKYTNVAADANTLLKNGQQGQFANGSEYEAGPVDTGVDLSKDNITADFYAVVAIGARSTSGYTLQFTAGPFAAKANKDDHPVACASSSLVTQLPADNSLANIIVLDGDVSSVGNNVKSQDILFKGSPVTSKIDIVKFTATWNADSAIDMGTYYADVSLKITAK